MPNLSGLDAKYSAAYSLLDKTKNKQITVGVVGIGYVGFPLAVEKG